MREQNFTIIPKPFPINEQRRWTAAEIEFLKAKINEYSWDQLAIRFNRKLGSVRFKAASLNLIKSDSKIKTFRKDGWTVENIELLKKLYPRNTCKEISLIIPKTAASIKTKAGELGLKKSRFQKSVISSRPNKGQFKKGNLPVNTLIDHEITTRTCKGISNKWIRISLGKWQQLSIYNWIKAGNKYEKGMIISFKDALTMNCEPSNLKMITKAENLWRNRKKASNETFVQCQERKAKQRAAIEIRKKNKIEERERHLKAKLERRSLIEQKLAIQKDEIEKKKALSSKKINIKAVSNVVKPAIKISKRENKNEIIIAKQAFVKAEKKRLESAQKEAQRIFQRSEAIQVLPNRKIDFSEMVKIKIDDKTSIYIKPNQDPELAKQRYINRIKNNQIGL